MRTQIARFGTLAWLLASLASCADTASEDQDPSAATAIPLVAADVSFLLPLGEDGGLSAGSTGQYGVVVPRAVFDAVEPLTRVDEPDALYNALSVVAVRLDPCFFEGRGPRVCSSQIRLVLQPVLSIDGTLTTRDATLHAFYDVPVPELRELATTLSQARVAASGSEAVGVSAIPDLARQEVLKYVGESRLRRITFVSVHASDEAWSFGGYDIDAGNLVPLQIPGVPEPEQHLSSLGGLSTLDSTILPAPTIETAIDRFIQDDERVLLTDGDIEQAVAALGRLLDPAAHNPGTVDCASCHVATAAMRFVTASSDPALVSSVYDDSRNQRMFGWFGSAPSISPRVFAETDAVLAIFNAQP